MTEAVHVTRPVTPVYTSSSVQVVNYKLPASDMYQLVFSSHCQSCQCLSLYQLDHSVCNYHSTRVYQSLPESTRVYQSLPDHQAARQPDNRTSSNLLFTPASSGHQCQILISRLRGNIRNPIQGRVSISLHFHLIISSPGFLSVL
jgi:hypothetical protein